MLVLTRRKGTGLVITLADGTRVKLVVLPSHGTEIRVGVAAPPAVRVDRAEAPRHWRRRAGRCSRGP